VAQGRASRRAQRGLALVALLTVAVLAFAYVLTTRLNAASMFVGVDRDHNAKVMAQAKQALIGYMALRAGKSGEQDPGALPCPEAAGDYNDLANEGRAAANCTLPAVGRLPWRTLGLDKLTDASGEPLWYVVSPGWAKPNSTTNTVINSNWRGQLTVDGVGNDAVALIIAPGQPLPTQARNSASASPVDYLDGENSAPADTVFVTTGPAASFNDQVLRVTTRDVLPLLEAAISQRMEREISPLLRSVYSSSSWSANINSTHPAYPFPAPFADPGLMASFRGSAASCSGGDQCQGLFPAIFGNAPGTNAPCTPADGALCDPSFVRWTGGTVQRTGGATMIPSTATCSVTTVTVSSGPPVTETTRLDCTFRVNSLLSLSETLDVRVQANVANVGMALRGFNSAATVPDMTTIAPTPDVTLNTDGSASVTINGRITVGPGNLGTIVSDALCGLVPLLFACREVTISVPMTFFPDHALLDSRTASPTGWFMRNEWYRVLYYAISSDASPSNLPSEPGCNRIVTPLSCLDLNGARDKRAMFVLAGRSLSGTIGDTRTLNDFLDSAENRDGDWVFGTLPAGSRFNDRVVMVQVDDD
jgi:hypothetical protein